MSLDTKWLEDFLMLVETRNFSRAAEMRHITQPAFGRHIKALENNVGKVLIDRSTTPVTLTPAGRQFRSVARNIVSQVNEGINLLNGHNQPLPSRVRITSPHILASSLLPDLMNLVSDPKKNIAFKIDILRVDFAVESLINGECDFLIAFDMSSLLQPPFQNICIGSGDFLLVSAANKKGKLLFDLERKAVPFIGYSKECYSARLIERYPLVQPIINSFPFCETSMPHLNKVMVQDGKGISWLPDCLIKNELNNKELIAIEPNTLKIPYQIRLYRNSSRLSAEAENMWDFIENKTFENWKITTPWH